MMITIVIESVEDAENARKALMKLYNINLVDAPAPASKPSPKSTAEVIADPGVRRPADLASEERDPSEIDAPADDRKSIIAELTERGVKFNKSASTKNLFVKLEKVRDGSLPADQYEGGASETPAPAPAPAAAEQPAEEKQTPPAAGQSKLGEYAKKNEADVRAELQKLVARCGRDAAAAVLQIAGRGAAKASELTPENYPAFFALVHELHSAIAADIAAGTSDADAVANIIKRLKKGWKK